MNNKILLNEVREIVNLMNRTFDSHDFLCEYNKQFPDSYNLLLTTNDINSAHGVIGMYLGNHASVLRIHKLENASHESININGKSSHCSCWEKTS